MTNKRAQSSRMLCVIFILAAMAAPGTLAQQPVTLTVKDLGSLPAVVVVEMRLRERCRNRHIEVVIEQVRTR